jgi:hypothetical protein
MKRRLAIPVEVRDAIEQHVRKQLDEAESRYWSAAEDEDTFTGQLGALLATPERTIVADDRIWSWGIDYTKFRGRGKDATEAVLGADGIFEIRVNGIEIQAQKSLLFQSKMGYPSGKRAIEQALMMSNWREAAVFLAYNKEGVTTYSIDAVLRGETGTARPDGARFANFFNRSFLACKVGDSDLQYDAKSRTLEWRDENRNKVAVHFSIPHRIRVSVDSPNQHRKQYQVISPKEIGKHRMDSTPEDRLGLDEQFTLKQLTKAKREAALTFHPDLSQNLADPLKMILNQRMGEINAAYAELKAHKKDKD